MLSYSKGRLWMELDKESGTAVFGDYDEKISFAQKNSGLKISDAKETVAGIEFKVCLDGAELSCRYSISDDETGSFFELSIDSESEFDSEGICFPPAINAEQGMRVYDPICEGMAYNVEDKIPIPKKKPFYGGAWCSMSFWGIKKNDGSWLMTVVDTPMDAVMMTEKNSRGLYETYVLWESEKGSWGYCRKLRFYLGKNDEVTKMCCIYRKIAKRRGLVKTLQEKAAQLPIRDCIAGSANVWLWNNDAMDKLYSENSVYSIPSKEMLEARRNVAKDMKENGMDRVLWSIFDENIDKETVEYVKSLGYFTTYYDVYTDVIPGDYASLIPETRRRRCAHRVPYWPEGIIVRKDGSLCPAWDLKGIDGKFYPQNRMCDTVVPDCAKKYVKEHGIENGIQGVFIDVSFCDTYECYSEKHPLTRREGMEEKQKLFEMLQGMGVFTGTENGTEFAVPCCDYTEGMMSPTFYRAYDSGRRMTHIYEEEQMGEKFNLYMLNPGYRVPMWEMVFHDCQTSYPYWGDSANSLPSKIKERDLFSILYGQPPLYSFKVADWHRIKADVLKSYSRTVPHARALRGVRMTAFKYLTEDMQVQQTVFENGTEVIVNFGETDFEYNGKNIASKEAYVEKRV